MCTGGRDRSNPKNQGFHRSECEQNVRPRSKAQAKDAQTLITLHGEFVQSQMQLLTEQARILGEVSSKTAMDAAKSKS
jgi:hypothetical protein